MRPFSRLILILISALLSLQNKLGEVNKYGVVEVILIEKVTIPSYSTGCPSINHPVHHRVLSHLQAFLHDLEPIEPLP
jgi:hypothetical protein